MENEFTQAKSHFSKIGLMFFLGTLIAYAVQFIASAIAGTMKPELFSDTTASLLVTMVPLYLIAFPLMILLIRRIPASPVVKKKMTARQWLISFLICFGGVYVGNFVGIFLAQIIGILKGSPVGNPMLEVATSTSLWANFFLMVLCAPVFEEIIFRKLLIDRMAKYGESIAVLFSGLMFGLFHGNLNQFAYAFILGIFFAFIYVKTRNIRYTILLHMLINFIGSVLSVMLIHFIDLEALMAAANEPANMMAYATSHSMQLLLYGLYTLAALGTSLAGVILFFVNLKKMHFLPGTVSIPKGKRFSVTLLNAGMLLYFIFWMIIIIVQLFM